MSNTSLETDRYDWRWFADFVLKAWRNGQDTYEIAQSLSVSQASVYSVIAWEQDSIYAERQAAL